MALYDLVTLRKELLDNLDASASLTALLKLRTNIANIKIKVPVLEQDHERYLNNLIHHYDQLIAQVTTPQDELTDEIKKINNEINVITQRLFAGNYELEESYGDCEFVRNTRRMHMREDIEDAIKQRILQYTTWRYPALEIGCRDGEWTQYLVASDPLYVMDRHEEFLDSTAGKFPNEFLKRLRRYHLVDHNLAPVPQGQFGFVFSWGYFNYVSLDTMKNYLKQVFQSLRPGGVFMFSYNDGDTPSGAGMAEKFSQTYMPKSLLIPLCELLGFELVRDFDFEPNVSWLEVKKPGTLNTIKAHQVLGKPMGIPLDYDPVEEPVRLFKDGQWIDTVEIRWVPRPPQPL